MTIHMLGYEQRQIVTVRVGEYRRSRRGGSSTGIVLQHLSICTLFLIESSPSSVLIELTIEINVQSTIVDYFPVDVGESIATIVVSISRSKEANQALGSVTFLVVPCFGVHAHHETYGQADKQQHSQHNDQNH